MNELDKIFRSKLENQTAEYSDQSWDKIQSRLMKQKSKLRKFPWLWTSLIAVIVVGAIYLWSTVDDKQSDSIQGTTKPMVVNTDSQNQSKDAVITNDNHTTKAQTKKLDAVNAIDISEEDISLSLTHAANNNQVSIGNRNESKTIGKDHLNSNISGLQQRISDSEISNTILVNSNLISTKSNGQSVDLSSD